MIRPNLRNFAAAVACLMFGPSVASAQHGYEGGDPSMFRLPRSTWQAPIEDHYIRGNTGLWDENRPIERFLTDVTRNSWLKLEFLSWEYDDVNYGQIGAPVAGLTRNTRGELQGLNQTVSLVDNLNNQAIVGEALFPTGAYLDQLDVPGIRGTLGVALSGGELELSFFGLAQSSDDFLNDDMSAARTRVGLADVATGTTAFPNLAVPLLTNGQPGTIADLNALVFNESFYARVESQMWGTEVTVLTEKLAPGGAGASWQWLGGFRYLNQDEVFQFSGTSIGTAATSVSANTVNNFYGPEFGGRAALTSKYVTFSATPRIMFGLNDNTSEVGSSFQGVAGTLHRERDVDFGTITQINLAAEVHFSPAFSVYGGYDFMWLTGVSKPFNNVVYDSTQDVLGNRVADIRQQVDLQHQLVSGFSVGAVFRY